MNNDLISRSALLKNKTRMTEYDESGCGARVFVVREEDVLDAPAVDAVEVVHGRWEYARTDKYDSSFAAHRCSNCGHTNYAIAEYIRKGKWCPYCGAKMDGDVNAED